MGSCDALWEAELVFCGNTSQHFRLRINRYSKDEYWIDGVIGQEIKRSGLEAEV